MKWSEHALVSLEQAGYRSSAPRTAVVDALADVGCGVTAREIGDLLDRRGDRVGVASIYRALEVLEQEGLVQRFDVGDSAARYEPALPSGEHHHHLVCDRCGEVRAFEDEDLERVIRRLANRVDFAIDAHDVTLKGECPACATRTR
ncbi:MAG TPA: Fur family transcriptional regulator [Thermoleophilaceae bacterium]